jgi:hypothetical protein
MLPEVIDKLRHVVLELRDRRCADAQLQPEQNRFVGQHYELIRTLSLMLTNLGPYPLAVAIEILQDMKDASGELALLEVTLLSCDWQ